MIMVIGIILIVLGTLGAVVGIANTVMKNSFYTHLKDTHYIKEDKNADFQVSPNTVNAIALIVGLLMIVGGAMLLIL